MSISAKLGENNLMKHLVIFFALIILGLNTNTALAVGEIPAVAQSSGMSNFVTPQNVSTDICTKLYSTSTEKLFYLAISAINANNFHIDEIQSKTGYILFTAVNRQFLATIVKFSSSKAMLKITPVSNVYYFQPGIVLNMFKYIDLNVQDTPIVNVSVLR